MSILLRVLYPIAPHISTELWNELKYSSEIEEAPWPQVDDTALVQNDVELVLQVNGKRRGCIVVPTDASREIIEKIALADKNAQRHVLEKKIRKVIIVPNRLVNLVV